MVTVVYVFEPVGTDGEELRYSLRSLENYNFEHNVVIVGSPPEWYKGDTIQSRKVNKGKYSRAFDIVRKLKAAISSKKVSEDFVYMYDDQYILKPIGMDTLQPSSSEHFIQGAATPSHGTMPYKDLMRWTVNDLLTTDVIWNYETHLPRVFNKRKLEAIITGYDLENEPRLISTLYYNEYYSEPVIKLKGSNIKAGIYTKITREKLDGYIRTKKILNHSDAPDFKGVILPALKKMFPEKSKYEK